MSLLQYLWRLFITLGNILGNTLGNKQKIPAQKILSFLRKRNRTIRYIKDVEKHRYQRVVTTEYFKIPSYDKLLNGEFADIMETLQHLNGLEVVNVIHSANIFYKEYNDKFGNKNDFDCF